MKTSIYKIIKEENERQVNLNHS